MKNIWYQMSDDEVYKELNTSKTGLTKTEAEDRLKKYGENKLPKGARNGLFDVFIKQFVDPIVIILLIAASFSIFIHEYIDALFIFIVIITDAILGTVQEWRAEQSAASISALLKNNVTVFRDGQEVIIQSEFLVQGDIIKLTSGDKVPADVRFITSENLAVDEAFLTGESINIHKLANKINGEAILPERINMGFAGSKIMSGRALAVVVETALNTEIGKIANTVMTAEDTKTPLAIRMEKFTKQISVFIAFLAIFLSFILYIKGFAPREIFFFVVALSVSAIPEGLPMVLTIALSIATNKMGKKNVIVRRLNAVESLGSCTVIASDKTGTLTVNEQTVKKVVFPDSHSFDVSGTGYNGEGEISASSYESSYKGTKSLLHDINKLIFLNNEAVLTKKDDTWVSHGDSMDIALLALSYKIKPLENEVKNEIISLIPYESEKKYSGVIFKEGNKNIITLKGSFEVILEKCNTMNTASGVVPLDASKVKIMNNELAAMGYRVLAVAKGEEEKKLTFMALIAFIDPVRAEAKDAVMTCRKAGIDVLMITGDHQLTARAIATEIGIISSADEVTTGAELEKVFEKGNDAFDLFVKTRKVFARVTPSQKLEIVEAYKRNGEFIAVTGDGVNDAPALKSANIGIAMGSGTEVAKETSDMIILDDNFTSIVTGVEEGRYAYSNVRKVTFLLISCGLAEVLLFILAIFFNLPMPLLAVQLLWLNLVTNGIQDVALAFEKGEQEVMLEKPRKPKESLFNKDLLTATFISALTMAAMVFTFYYVMLNKFNLDIKDARSYVLIMMVFMQNFHVFNARSETKSAFKIPLKNNLFVAYGVFGTIVLQWIVSETHFMSKVLHITPMSFGNILISLLMSVPLLVTFEIYKYIKRKKA